MNKNIIILILAMTVTVFGCATTQSGIGTPRKSDSQVQLDSESVERKASEKAGQVVLLIPSYKRAIEIAAEVAQLALPSASVSISGYYDTVEIMSVSLLKGDVRSVIVPKTIEELHTGRTGFIYEVSNQGVGFNASMIPSYVSKAFFKELSSYVQNNNIAVANFANYRIIKTKGKTDVAPASIPVTYIGFKQYLDQKSNKDPFEGIWVDQDGNYTLGIIKSEKDPRYTYIAFIIESDTIEWKPGDIKIKFNELLEGNVAISRYYMRNKIDIGIMWKTSSSTLITLNAPNDMDFALVKSFPSRKSKEIVSGSGTAWAVTNDGIFLTNGHIVKEASEIYIGFKEENPYKARVLILDDRTDLAVLKAANIGKSITPLPIRQKLESNGEPVCALGYPLTNILGDTLKITDGIISAQSGVNNDVTVYQITAPVQPGNSGGPLFNSKGEVIGVTNTKLSDRASTDGDVENINFAIKSIYIIPLLQQLKINPYKLEQPTVLTTKEIFNKYSKSVLPIWVK